MFPTPFPWYRLPELELARFKAIDFFPPKPARLDELKSICIGSKSRTIGDALMLSSLPRRLKQRYPRLRILSYPRGFNPVVFWNNPHVDGISFLPDALYGDDINEGSGHLIQLKERFFGVESGEKPRPEIYVTGAETHWAREFLRSGIPEGKHALPLLVIHAAGGTNSKVLAPELWTRFVTKQSGRFRILQVGVQGQVALPGCDLHLLAPRKRASARELFALLKEADLFIGVDSGPMHVARAFDVRSLILWGGEPPERVFAKRKQGAYFLHDNRVGAFLYEEQEHLHVPSLDGPGVVRALSDFASRN